MSKLFKKYNSNFQKRAFWDGFVDGLTCWLDVFEPPKLYREKRESIYEKYDINAALKADCDRIFKDMWKAIKEAEGEIESSKTNNRNNVPTKPLV